jgi:hypothetical protein
MIKTTINISEETLNALIDASFQLNISETDIIKLLMMNSHLDNKKDDRYLKFFSIIKYQERDPEIKWICLHISLTPEEYEHFIDMRKMFKMSVSYIIAFALKKYLNILLKNHPKNKWKDNNPQIYFSIYVFYVDFVHGVKSYVISSELPENLQVKTKFHS